MFHVYDYTDATRLFGEEFKTKATPPIKRRTGPEPPEPSPIIQVEGFDVHVTDAGRYIVTQVHGKAVPVTVEEYKQQLAKRLIEESPTIEEFRTIWVRPAERRELIGRLPESGRSALLVRELADMKEFDLFDVLGELGYGLNPLTRTDRAEAFAYKYAEWLKGLPQQTAATLQVIASQFGRGGTEGIENPHIFQIPEVIKAGGVAALSKLGEPADVLRETKVRMFEA
jgi:type I restriction enzyme R subunit